jgi:hypothetical protein
LQNGQPTGIEAAGPSATTPVSAVAHRRQLGAEFARIASRQGGHSKTLRAAPRQTAHRRGKIKVSNVSMQVALHPRIVDSQAMKTQR